MSARCFDDTCSVETTEVITGSGPAIQIAARLDAARGLECTDPDGIRVKLLNDTSADVTAGRECANILRRDSSGNLHALVPLVIPSSSSNSGYAAVPAAADQASPASASLAFSYENESDCDQLLIGRGQFQLGYVVMAEDNATAAIPNALIRSTGFNTAAPPGVTPGASPATQQELIPFNAQWIARLKRQITGPGATAMAPVIADHFSTSGFVVNVDPNDQYKSEWRNFVWVEELRSGATITFNADIYHDGPDQTVNIATSPASDSDPNVGFRVHNFDLFALPLGVL